jgi:antitoxin HicB
MKHREPVTTVSVTYTVVFERDPESGCYTVTVPALPAVVSQGRTLDEARVMAADAIRGYLEYLRDEGRPIPANDAAPSETIREKLTVSI